MKKVYQILAFVIVGLVAVQASAAVYAEAGMFLWVASGGVIDKALMESGEIPPFEGVLGLMVHGMNGMMVIPAVALLLLISSFFAKVPRGTIWAATVAALVALQVSLGLWGHEAAIGGLLHGFNALVLATVALLTGLRVGRTPTPAQARSEPARTTASVG